MATADIPGMLTGLWQGRSVLSTTIVGLLVFLGYKLLAVILHVRKMNRIFGAIPGPTNRHWLYGNFIEFPESSHERMMHFVKLTNQFSAHGYFRLWLTAASPLVVVCAPETVKRVLKTTAPKPRGYAGPYRFLEPWLGEGLLVAGGAKWARSRRLLTPAFHFDILKPYVSVYNEAAEIFADKIERHAVRGEKFEVYQYVCLCTLDIILRCAFSYDIDPQRKGERHPYVIAVTDLSHDIDHRFRRPYLYPDFLWNRSATGRHFLKHCDYVHDVAEDIIKRRRTALESSGPSNRKYLDFLDILLTAKDEDGEGMSPLDIRNEVDTFLFEGHDTTASAISWILYSLAGHPDSQVRVQAEIDAVLEGRDDDVIQWGDLPRLEFLSMCIKEGMRLHSPVAQIARSLTSDLDMGDRVLPSGTPVQVNIWAAHHNARVWGEDHFHYKPERFSKENVAKMDSYQFVPFSAGPRNCIGQHFAMNEEKVVLARLLRKFTFTLDPEHVVRKKLAAVMRSETGIMLFAKLRQ